MKEREGGERRKQGKKEVGDQVKERRLSTGSYDHRGERVVIPSFILNIMSYLIGRLVCDLLLKHFFQSSDAVETQPLLTAKHTTETHTLTSSSSMGSRRPAPVKTAGDVTASFPAPGVGEGEAAFKALFVCKQSAESRPNALPPAAINNQQTPHSRGEKEEGRNECR